MKTLAAMALLAAAHQPVAPWHSFEGWGPSTLPVATVSYEATLAVPATAPPGTAYAWVMAQGGGSANGFTQIGFAWMAPPNLGYEGPVLFAYTTPPGQAMTPAGWVFGEQLVPGSSVSVRIVRDGDDYADQVLWQGSWATLASGSFPTRPLWSTMDETYGGLYPVCFSDRSYQTPRGSFAQPAGCQP